MCCQLNAMALRPNAAPIAVHDPLDHSTRKMKPPRLRQARAGKTDRAHRRIGNDRYRRDAEANREDEAPNLVHQIVLFVFKGSELARVGNRGAYVAQRLEQMLGPAPRPVHTSGSQRPCRRSVYVRAPSR